ncbi:MAG: acyl-CoA-binding protein [Sphingobacteriales bacterium]|nr:MAG: acyl-CoA-binding protein [Sphingobacteriales bacterium]
MNFEEAVALSKTLKEKPANDVLLELYSLFKQVTEGDAPEKGEYNMFDFVAKSKHNAWLQLKGESSESAKEKYVDLVTSLLATED